MVAGMLDLPVAKFITPNIIGCLLWPPFTSCTRVLAGAAIPIFLPGCRAVSLNGCYWQQRCFVGWRLATAAVMAQRYEATDRLSHYLSRGRLLWLTPLISAIGVVALVVLIRHPLMPVYIDIFLRKSGWGLGIALCGLPDATLAASYRAYKTHYL